jgi:uncharacterized membrane protein YgcG
MKGILGRVLALFVLGGLIAFPLLGWHWPVSDAESETTTITDYRVRYDVAANGEMRVQERITVQFGYGKHGIFQFFDHADENAPTLRRVPQDITVQRDGEPEGLDVSTEDHGRITVAQIGRADTTIPVGTHVYLIRYTIDDVLLPRADGGSRFYWNLVPGGWRQPIDHAELTVRLPSEAGPVLCAVGYGRTSGCSGNGSGSDRVAVTVDGLEPDTPVTVRTDLSTPAPPVIGEQRPWSPRWDPVLGPSAPGVVLISVLGLLALAAGGLAARAGREKDPQFPLMYTPPEGIGPAQAAYLLTEQVDERQQFVASIMYAAERGVLTLDRQGESWTLTESGQSWDALDPITGELRDLTRGDGSFTASPTKSGHTLATQIQEMSAHVRSWASREHLMTAGPFGGSGKGLVLLALAAAVANAIWSPFDCTLLSIIPGLFAVGALTLLAPGSATTRTPAGRELWSRAGGFRRVLATPSGQSRFEFAGRKELYTQYLPWAVAFGVADTWAAKYRTEMGVEPPMPVWLGSTYAGGQTGDYVNQMVGSFSHTVDSAISTYQASQASSGGSGFSSGGFSGGGGGGGGGGGSW